MVNLDLQIHLETGNVYQGEPFSVTIKIDGKVVKSDSLTVNAQGPDTGTQFYVTNEVLDYPLSVSEGQHTIEIDFSSIAAQIFSNIYFILNNTDIGRTLIDNRKDYVYKQVIFWFDTIFGYQRPTINPDITTQKYWQGWAVITSMLQSIGAGRYDTINGAILINSLGQSYESITLYASNPFTDSQIQRFIAAADSNFNYDPGTNTATYPAIPPAPPNGTSFDLETPNGQVQKGVILSLADFDTLQTEIGAGSFPGSIITNDVQAYFDSGISTLSQVVATINQNSPDPTQVLFNVNLSEVTIIGPQGTTHKITGSVSIKNNLALQVQVNGDLGISESIIPGGSVSIPVSSDKDLASFQLEVFAPGDAMPFVTKTFPVSQTKQVDITASIDKIQAFINPQGSEVIAGIQVDYTITNPDPQSAAVATIEVDDFLSKTDTPSVPPLSKYKGSFQIDFIQDFAQYQQSGGKATITIGGNALATQKYSHSTMPFTVGTLPALPQPVVSAFTPGVKTAFAISLTRTEKIVLVGGAVSATALFIAALLTRKKPKG